MVRKNVAEILTNHVTFELEAIDRMYLNAYVPSLQTGAGLVYFLKTQLGVRVPSTVMVAPISERFVDGLERFVEMEGIDLVTFEKGQRKDDVAQQYLAAFDGDEGVLFIGRPKRRRASFAPKATRRGRKDISVDHPLDGDGQSLLCLHPRPRLRPVVHQVLLVLSLSAEAVSEGPSG